jgi:hypothetical protein
METAVLIITREDKRVHAWTVGCISKETRDRHTITFSN